MANAIPMLEGTPASGGYNVPDTQGETLQNTILRESAVLGLARVDRVVGRRQKYTVYAGRPVATFVAEGAPKSTTGAEWAEITVDVKKIVAQVIYTEELLEDAREDPRVLVNADVEGAIADTIDAHALGYAQRRRDRRFVRLGTDEHDA
jgi:HK97 family phage major capsid protein